MLYRHRLVYNYIKYHDNGSGVSRYNLVVRLKHLYNISKLEQRHIIDTLKADHYIRCEYSKGETIYKVNTPIDVAKIKLSRMKEKP